MLHLNVKIFFIKISNLAFFNPIMMFYVIKVLFALKSKREKASTILMKTYKSLLKCEIGSIYILIRPKNV